MTAARIRKARPADAQRIAEVHVRAMREAFRGLVPQAELDRLGVRVMARRWAPLTLTHGGGFFVAEDEKLWGFCCISPARRESVRGRLAELLAVYVDPRRQSRGIGTTLIRTALEHVDARGFTHVMLWVLPGNQRARRLYERLGFVSDGTARTDHGLRVTAPHLEYRRSLADSAAQPPGGNRPAEAVRRIERDAPQI